MSFAMTSHAVRMLWINLQDALRLTLVPFLVVQAITVGLPLAMIGDATITDPFQVPEGAVDISPEMTQFAFVQILVLIGSIIAGAWLAVVWHRFVLLEEYPNGYVPPFTATLVMGYVGRLIVIAVVVLAGGLLGGTAVAVFSALAPPLAILGGIALVIAMVWIAVRLSVMLPAAAIGTRMSVGEAWEHTKDTHPALLGATILMAIFNMIILIPALLLMMIFVGFEPTGLNPAQVLINLVFGWISTMLTVSLATTLYGVAVEGRQLT